MLSRALQAAAGNGISTVAVAEAIDFDGTNDALSRSSLTGNADSKTLTCSVFFYAASITGTDFLVSFRNNAVGQHFAVKVANNAVYIDGGNASATAILAANTPTSPSSIALNTWNHVLISIDLANTSNRSIYINDIAQSVTWSTYTNDSIAFSTNVDSFRINALSSITGGLQGRLSNVFLDYTYRDLSIEANRRLFVTADLKPAAGQAALNPILYLPMDDPTQPGLNAGTGGDFTLTGVVARSGRGPNQYNAPLSTFVAASAQTVYKAINLTTTDFTLAFNLRPTTTGSLQSQISYYVNSNSTINLYRTATNGNLVLRYWNGSSYVWSITLPNTSIANRNYNIVISNSSTSLHVSVNGVVTTSSGISSAIPINGTFKIMGDHNTATRDGIIGALWFNTSYIDLSVPDNLAKFVTGTGIDAKPVDLGANGELPTGTSPLIYLPMYGNNAGKNYGTGGDFTVNSGPYTGARGPNEFWGNKMRTTVSSYVGRTSAMTGVTSGKKFSCSFFVSQGQAAGGRVLSFVGDTGDNTEYLMIDIDVDGLFSIYGYNSSQVNILALPNMSFGGTATLANVYHVLIAVDLSTASYRIYVNGVSKSPSGGIVLTNDNIKFDGGRPSVGAGPVASGNAGDKSEFYFTTDYIDFSQEANRLKFRDAFGNPVDLTKQIEDGAIPNPAIYMRFDPASFGTNSGTGGDFAVNGTITDGGNL